MNHTAWALDDAVRPIGEVKKTEPRHKPAAPGDPAPLGAAGLPTIQVYMLYIRVTRFWVRSRTVELRPIA